MRNCYTKRRNAWKQQDFRCGVGSDGSAIRRDVFLRKEVFFFCKPSNHEFEVLGEFGVFFFGSFGIWVMNI